MKDYLSISSSPYEEDCVQVGSPDYARRSAVECQVFMAQLREQFPDADFRVKTFPHDFGSYKEVCVFYDPEDEEEADMAFAVESECWPHWTPENRAKLKERLDALAA